MLVELTLTNTNETFQSKENVMFAASVVIPTRNRRDKIITCLDALRNQTRGDFEIVLVDDGSTDDSVAARVDLFGSTPGV